MRDILSTLRTEQSLKPQTVQASALDSGNIDLQGFDSLAVVVAVGQIADTLGASNRLDLKIEHADDNGAGAPGAYAACTDDDVTGATGLTSGIFMSVNADTKDNARYAIGYRGGKRFVKVTATPVSLATGGPVAIVALKGHPALAPASNA